MNATKLTIIVLAAAAVMFSGCSTDNRVLGPGSDFQSGKAIETLNRTGFDTNESAPGTKYLTIVAKVLRVDIEGGCWYLQAEDGKTYTPLSPEDLTLETGLKLKAKGYIDENIQFFCGNGPAFVIEDYEIIEKPGRSESNESAENEYAKDALSLDNMNNGMLALKGFVDVTADGCIILETPDKDEYVLRHDADVQLDKGDQVSVTGYVSALPYFTCYEAPVFVAETISVFKSSTEDAGSDRPENEADTGITEDDNDRFVRPTEDRPSEDEIEDREQEEKKKLKEEMRPADPPENESDPSMTEDDEDNNDRFIRPTEDRPSEDELTDRENDYKKKLEEERRRDKDNERP
jgi:predicted small secreted protein